MLQQKCNYCESRDLKLENKSKFDIMEAPMVALKCATCGKFIKWCPKSERQFYITLETSYKDYQELCRLEEYERWADKEITKLYKQLLESEKKHLLDETEWQKYCAFKHIEPEIKSCLDREREYKKKVAELEHFVEEIEELISHNYIFYGWIPKDVLIKKINKLNEVIKGLENESTND